MLETSPFGVEGDVIASILKRVSLAFNSEEIRRRLSAGTNIVNRKAHRRNFGKKQHASRISLDLRGHFLAIGADTRTAWGRPWAK